MPAPSWVRRKQGGHDTGDTGVGWFEERWEMNLRSLRGGKNAVVAAAV